jgi:hypothetical protein
MKTIKTTSQIEMDRLVALGMSPYQKALSSSLSLVSGEYEVVFEVTEEVYDKYYSFTMYTKNDLVVDCKPLRALDRGYMLVYCQDRLVVASIIDATCCKEIESMDVLPFIEGYYKH